MSGSDSSKTSNIKKIKKIVSPEEYIKGCILIPSDRWLDIPLNSQICYYKNDNKFVKGGFVKLIFNKKDEDFIIYGTKLDKYNNDKYYKEFTIKLSNIKEIYKRIDQDAIVEYKLINANISKKLKEYEKYIADLKTHIDSLELRLNKEEANSRKILKLIKYLHKSSSLDNIDL